MCMHACVFVCVLERALTSCMPCIYFVKYFILLLSKKTTTKTITATKETAQEVATAAAKEKKLVYEKKQNDGV